MSQRPGWDRLEDRSGDWADREAGRFADRPARTTAKWLTIFGVGIVGLVVFFGVIGFAAGWFNTGKDIVSPNNVKKQYANVIEDYKAMEVAAANACQAVDTAQGRNDPSLIETAGFAYAAQYRHITVDYNRRQNNIFESKLVGPKGYPRNAPTLKEMQRRVC